MFAIAPVRCAPAVHSLQRRAPRGALVPPPRMRPSRWVCQATPTTLPALLRDNEQFAFEHGPGFANHNSMGLVALAAMGADAAELDTFYAGHAPHQAPLRDPTAIIEDADWQAHLGDRKQGAAYLRFFLQQAQTLDTPALLQRFLPRLIGGVGAGGFHGILRLAYALLLERELGVPARREIAHALAYLASSYLNLGHSAAAPEPCATLIARLSRSPEVQRGLAPSLLAPRMAKEARQPAFDGLAGTPQWEEGALAQLAAFAVGAHTAADNIASLHMITGMHAIRLLEPYWGDPQEALTAVWRALAALYMTAGAPWVPEVTDVCQTDASWDDLCQRARGAYDVHVIKLVYSCREESRLYGLDSHYRWLAERALNGAGDSRRSSRPK